MASSEENTERDDSASGATHVGALLQASRLRLGEDLPDVALMLRIRLPYLTAIEAGRYRDLPGATYAVGFIRAYAEHLGLDSEEVVRRFKVETIDGGSDQKLSFPTPVPETGIPGGAYVFVGLVVAVIAYGAWYVSTTEDGFLAELISPLDEQISSILSSEEETPAAQPSVEADADVKTAPDSATPETPAANEEANVNEVETEPASPETISRDADLPSTTETAASSTLIAAAPELDPAVADVEPVAAAEELAPTATIEPTEPPTATPATPVETDVAVTEPAPSVAEVAAVTPSPSSPVETEAPTTPAAATAASVEEAQAEPDAPDEGNAAAQAIDTVTNSVAASESVVEAEPLASQPVPSVSETAAAGTADTAPEPTPTAPVEPVSTAEITAETEPAPVVAAALGDVDAALPDLPVVPARTNSSSDAESDEVQVASTGGQSEPAAEEPSRIVINAKNNSWIQVRDDVANQMLVTRLLTTGDRYEVPNRPGLILLTGNAGALEILVDGTPAPSIGGNGVVRRGVVLEAERLKQGTAVTN